MKKQIIIIALTITALGVHAQTETNPSTDSIVAHTVNCAQAGNDTCQNLLGKWLFEGSHGYQKDHAKAVAWWKTAAKQNNSEATANLGFCYMYGAGVEADSTTASRLFEKAIRQGNQRLLILHDSLASKGNVLSAMLLARCYKMAIGVERNTDKTLKYYQLAAAQGNVEAMREAAILMRGNKAYANALQMFKQAMQQGDVTSTYYYGLMLCNGQGTAKDAQAGTPFLLRAAEAGYAAAQYEVAEAYANGNGVEKDDAKAFGWYHKAALSGNRAAMWQLAECHRTGFGTEVNFEEALNCYAYASAEGYINKLKALLSGDDPAWSNTPFIHYLRGMRLLNVEDNPNAAIKEFALMPKQMPLRATMEALCIAHKDFAKQNLKKAVKQLQKQSATCSRASYELALLQLVGNGIDKDVVTAEKTLNNLATSGYAPAINFLSDAYYEGNTLQQNRPKAILLYLQAEKQQRLSTIGASRLANAFRNGEGMKADTTRAESLEKYRAHDAYSLLNIMK